MAYRFRLGKFFKANIGKNNYFKRAIFETLIKLRMQIRKILKKGN